MSTQRLWGIATVVATAMTLIVTSMAPADAQSRRGWRGWGGGRCEAIVYQHVRYGGESMRINGDMPSLGGRWNDRISSIRVLSGDWTFYQHDDYRGERIHVGRNVPDVGGSWNDRISSARCNERGGWNDGGWWGDDRGCEAIIYRDSGFRGEQRRLVGDTPWIGEHWNDRVSSIRILSGRWVFYGDRDFRGPVYPVRRGDQIHSLEGGWNDRISSARCVR